jgi:8-oxo-dGTP pyrophosphatase MutT (NUDIX family)
MTSDVSGVVLLRQDGAALMQLRDDIPGISDPGMWCFPGGHCEPGEELETCARREFFEETRYCCADLLHLVTFSAGEIGYPGNHKIAFFLERFDGIQGWRCCEGQELRFLGRHEAVHFPMRDYVSRVWDLAVTTLRTASPAV